MEITAMLLLEVWQKGYVVKGSNDIDYRKDDYGNLMCFLKYGNRDSDLGWEIDHITPKADGGSDALSNLRPLQWQANVTRN